MEKKKHRFADVHRRRPLFQLIGLSVALLCVLAAFEFRTYQNYYTVEVQEMGDYDDILEIKPINLEKQPPPPPPPLPSPEVVEIEYDPADIEVLKDPIEPPEAPESQMEVPVIDLPEGLASEEADEIRTFASEYPKWKGEEHAAFVPYVQQVLEYFDVARRNGFSGKVILAMTVDKNGKLIAVEVVKGVHRSLDEAAVAAVWEANKNGEWTPAMQNYRAVGLRFMIPVKFQLR